MENEVVNLVGSGTDPDAEGTSSARVRWQQIGGPQVALPAQEPTWSFTAPQLTAAGDPDAKSNSYVQD
jgi:hypothetical protein